MTVRELLNYSPVELSFGTSGLRGLASDMTDLECYINTSGFLEFLSSNGQLAQGEKICLAGDLRESTPRILLAVARAIQVHGSEIDYCGLIPTPALAYYAQSKNQVCIMVTGSHIPADRNGIKFYKKNGEVMKDDEAAIKEHVAKKRSEVYGTDATSSIFDETGSLTDTGALPAVNQSAEELFFERNSIDPDLLKGKKIVVYQHSAVGRDLIVRILEANGAQVEAVGRSEVFIPIDTENVTPENKAYFKEVAGQFPDCFAIVSADGDSDRPFVIDEKGEFHRGDVVGCLVANVLGADFAAYPISCNDAVDEFLGEKGVEIVHTRIGSPYVIKAMYDAGDQFSKITGWEVNGGFMTDSDLKLERKGLKALPTRDAFLPIMAVLATATMSNRQVSGIFADLPARFTGGGLVDNVNEHAITVLRSLHKESPELPELIRIIETEGLGEVIDRDFTDGIRLRLKSNDVVHIRPSGNAPQLRVYTNCNSQESADTLAVSLVEQGGLLFKIIENLNGEYHE